MYEWSQELWRKIEKEDNKRLGCLLSSYNKAEYKEHGAMGSLKSVQEQMRKKMDWYKTGMENE
jgi:hypothetical protein